MPPQLVRRSLLVVALVSGCVKTVTQLPPLQPLSFAAWHSWYRDYAGVDVCHVTPASIEADLSKVNEVLVSFLQKTAASKEAYWAPEDLTVLEQSVTALSPALAAQQSTASRVLACKEFQGLEVENVSLFDAARRGQELARQARLRVAEGASVVSYVRAVSEIRQWKEEQRGEQETERSSWCAPKPDKVPVIYYASEDETGVTEWFFCDGSRVRASADHPAEFVPSALAPPVPVSTKKGAPTPATFIAAIETFPENYIHRAPKLPQPDSAKLPEADSKPPAPAATP